MNLEKILDQLIAALSQGQNDSGQVQEALAKYGELGSEVEITRVKLAVLKLVRSQPNLNKNTGTM